MDTHNTLCEVVDSKFYEGFGPVGLRKSKGVYNMHQAPIVLGRINLITIPVVVRV